MKKNETYFKVGLFTLGLGAVLIAGILLVGADTLGRNTFLVETYLNESVLGLSVGSEVLYRGVTIGRVKTITFAPSEYPMEIDGPLFADYSRYVVVIMAIDPEKFMGMTQDPAVIEDMIRTQIEQGLRFKLSYQGITGISFMEADYIDPDREIPLSVPWVPKRIYVPSRPGLISSFTQAIEGIFRRLEKMDIEAALEQMKSTLATMDQAVQDAKLGEVRTSFVTLVDEVRESNKQLGAFLQKAETIPDDFKTVLAQINRTLGEAETLLSRHEPDVDAVLMDLKILIQNFRDLSERVKQDPAQLFLSSPPNRSEVVQ
jgi:ABC-type transporter Mla subunit MlaD